MPHRLTRFAWLCIAAVLCLGAATPRAQTVSAQNGGYSYSISQSGTPQKQTLSVTINPDRAMVGQVASVYVFGKKPDGTWFSYTASNGMQSWDGVSAMPAYASYSYLLSAITLSTFTGLDLSAFTGTVLYAGYGSTSSSMITNNTYSPVYVEIPQTSRAGLTVCKDTKFALCASSTCTATGGTVTNNQGITFPAATCTCPVLRADNIADLQLGNQVGSCVAPDPNYVYSTFSFVTPYPQYTNGAWTSAPAPAGSLCYSPNSYAQCWNWRCQITGVQNGVELATCTCPIQTSAVWGQKTGVDSNCSKIPVGAALPAAIFDPTQSTSDTAAYSSIGSDINDSQGQHSGPDSPR